jgi:hypothetical protein
MTPAAFGLGRAIVATLLFLHLALRHPQLALVSEPLVGVIENPEHK